MVVNSGIDVLFLKHTGFSLKQPEHLVDFLCIVAMKLYVVDSVPTTDKIKGYKQRDKGNLGN